jgi:hypothetical protein
MLNAAITQFKLGDDGMIRYQPDASNPLPGEPFAKAVKGAKILEPDIEVIDAAGHDTDAVRGILREWIKNHVRTGAGAAGGAGADGRHGRAGARHLREII